MNPAIDIKQLGKKYRLSQPAPYLSLRDTISTSFRSLFSKPEKKIDFWALQDINLQINQGERVGIIGRNGAGKSTLLKILSRVTWPTTGGVTINGRLSSLLEVGTGFHPELTGRENIYLNGSILGLKKAEIDRQYDAIVDFSGVSAFLDTPLKNYSSGMQLRLAFAVAAHLEPEILLIDEVLAVGDIEFQKKCLGKMEEVSRQQGRTILFVSHNLNYISSLCDHAIWLDKGKVIANNTVSSVIQDYTSQVANRSSKYEWHQGEQPGNSVVRLLSIRTIDSSGAERSDFKVTEKIGIEMHYEVKDDGNILWLGHNIDNQYGINVFDTHSVNTPFYTQSHPKGQYHATAWIPAHFLNTGSYLVSTAIFNHQQKVVHLHEREILQFNVYDVFDENTARGMSPDDFPGVVRPLLNWSIDKH